MTQCGLRAVSPFSSLDSFAGTEKHPAEPARGRAKPGGTGPAQEAGRLQGSGPGHDRGAWAGEEAEPAQRGGGAAGGGGDSRLQAKGEFAGFKRPSSGWKRLRSALGGVGNRQRPRKYLEEERKRERRARERKCPGRGGKGRASRGAGAPGSLRRGGDGGAGSAGAGAGAAAGRRHVTRRRSCPRAERSRTRERTPRGKRELCPAARIDDPLGAS